MQGINQYLTPSKYRPGKSVLLAFLITFVIACTRESGVTKQEPSLTFSEILKVKEISEDSHFLIYVKKSDRILEIRHESTKLISYPIVLGGVPKGDKRRQGDEKTPEGKFGIRAFYPHDNWSKFIWIDYPNEESWEKFRNAKSNGEIPQNAKIGGEIGIHGVPENKDYLIDENINWTLGCISLKNKNINDFFPFINIEKWDIEIVP